MPHSELLTIGAFARASGLTASALRFYADSGLLAPASVDQNSGYRYYAPDQTPRALLIRRLREIGMPLEQITEVLGTGGTDAARLIDEHVAGLAHRARRARETAAAVKAALSAPDAGPSVRVAGAAFTAAVGQVLTATAHEPALPALAGVRVEVSADGVVLTATDRYWLSTRTLVPSEPPEGEWSATLDADDLRLALPWARRRHELRLGLHATGARLHGDGTSRDCRTLAEPFPDYRLVLASLPEVRTRVLIARNPLVRALEALPGRRARLDVSADAVTLGRTVLPAVVTGSATTLAFDVTTLHPAVSTAVGPEVMLDIAAPDEPVVVRSADDGDLTTVAMPISLIRTGRSGRGEGAFAEQDRLGARPRKDTEGTGR